MVLLFKNQFHFRLQHLEGSQASLILPFSPSKVQPTQEGTEIQKLSYESAKGREYLAGLPSSEDLGELYLQNIFPSSVFPILRYIFIDHVSHKKFHVVTKEKTSRAPFDK